MLTRIADQPINRIEDAITVESRRERSAHKRNPGLRDNADASDCVHADLPHIATLIADGEITVGILNPVGCAAVATDGHNTLAMLKRRPDETLTQLLTRLDQAIERAWTEKIYTDEINPPVSPIFRATRKRRG